MKNKKILITGASGFVGTNLVEELNIRGYSNLETPSSKELNMTNEESVSNYFSINKPQVVLHIAGLVGGIAANKAKPKVPKPSL